jgi:hypothetical protein
MTGRNIAERLEWLQAEKELTRRRQKVPWVPVDKEYVFDPGEGWKTLRDLFAGPRNGLFTTSCSVPIGSRGVRAARSRPIASTAQSSISTISM